MDWSSTILLYISGQTTYRQTVAQSTDSTNLANRLVYVVSPPPSLILNWLGCASSAPRQLGFTNPCPIRLVHWMTHRRHATMVQCTFTPNLPGNCGFQTTMDWNRRHHALILWWRVSTWKQVTIGSPDWARCARYPPSALYCVPPRREVPCALLSLVFDRIGPSMPRH